GTVLLAVALVTLLAPLTEGRAAGWPLITVPRPGGSDPRA
ncbi:DUF3982 domain-containing protein, partial [Streptomyces sp. NPDC004362]